MASVSDELIFNWSDLPDPSSTFITPTLLSADIDNTLSSNPSNNRYYSLYSSPERNFVIELCGWGKDPFKISEHIENLKNNDKFEEAAAISLFNLSLSQCYTCLSDAIKHYSNTSEGGGGGEKVFDQRCVTINLVQLLIQLCTNNTTVHYNEYSISKEEVNTSGGQIGKDSGVGFGATDAIVAQLMLSRAINPYLQSIISFITSQPSSSAADGRGSESNDKEGGSDFHEIMTNKNMDLMDRVAFGCKYLSDSVLPKTLSELFKLDYLTNGDLRGLIISGVTSSDGLDLLQRYVDRTGDIQTAIYLSLHGFTRQALEELDEFWRRKFSYWILSYRDLLDRWTLWDERAQFNEFCCQVEYFPDELRPGETVKVVCSFCNKSISSLLLSQTHQTPVTVASSGISGGSAGGAGGQTSNAFYYSRSQSYHAGGNKAKITACQSCRKPIPRCSICLLPMGTGSGSTSGIGLPGNSAGGGGGSGGSHNQTRRIPSSSSKLKSGKVGGNKLGAFNQWFTWCQLCRHGGHTDHILSWFIEHNDCPVIGCSCACMDVDGHHVTSGSDSNLIYSSSHSASVSASSTSTSTGSNSHNFLPSPHTTSEAPIAQAQVNSASAS